MSCMPSKTAAPGSQHILSAQGVGERIYEWTGKLWSTPGTGFGTKPGAMAVLGWKYVRAVSAPATQATPAADATPAQADPQNVMKRIADLTAKYQGMQPDDGETRESWYQAAFDLISGEIAEVITSAATPAQDEREAFERWAATRCLRLPKHPDSEYASVTTSEAWEAWQASAALRVQPADQPKGEA